MKRHILSLSVICSLLLCTLSLPSCLGDDGTTFSLEPGNPLKMLTGTWRIKDIFKGSQNAGLNIGSYIPLSGGNQLKIGDLLAFGQGIGGQLGQSGTFSLISSGGTVSLPYSFTETVKDGIPYTGGIRLGGLLFDIKCWTPERWIIYPDADDDPWYIELEHDDDDEPDDVPQKPDVTTDGLVKKIVKRLTPWHGNEQIGDIRTWTYEFTYQNDGQPATISIRNGSATTYTYVYGSNQITLRSSGSTVKTGTLKGKYISGEDSGSLSLWATVTQSSSFLSNYAFTYKNTDGRYLFNRASTDVVRMDAGHDDFITVRGEWTYSYDGSSRNNTNLDLNCFITQLFDTDPLLLLPFKTAGFYGEKEMYLISGGTHGFKYWQNFKVQTNSSSKPTLITYEEVEKSAATANDFKTGAYRVEITYY